MWYYYNTKTTNIYLKNKINYNKNTRSRNNITIINRVINLEKKNPYRKRLLLLLVIVGMDFFFFRLFF